MHLRPLIRERTPHSNESSGTERHEPAQRQGDPSPPPTNQHRPAAQPARAARVRSTAAPPTAPIPTHSVSCNVRSVCKISASTGCISARHTSLSVKEGAPPTLEGVWPYLELSHRRREATAVHARTRCHAADELESSAHSTPHGRCNGMVVRLRSSAVHCLEPRTVRGVYARGAHPSPRP